MTVFVPALTNIDDKSKETLLDVMPWSKKLPEELRIILRK